MSNPLQQTIEALAKEKGIEPDVVISAIEEAVATASRKYYRTGENLKTRLTYAAPGSSYSGDISLQPLHATFGSYAVDAAVDLSVFFERDHLRVNSGKVQ